MKKFLKKKIIFKNNKGITLIALIVTIIVLLILAGISISMLSGENGILNRAGEAKEKTELSSLKEEVGLIMQNRKIEKETMGTNSKTLKQDLETGISGANIEEIAKADETTKYTDVYYVTKNGQTVTVYEDGEVLEGKVSIWKGATDIECPELKKDETTNVWNWYIYTAGQLKFLADFVNNGDGTTLPEGLTNYVTQAGYDPSTVTMSTDTTIYLMNNLDIGARPGEGATDEEKWERNPDELKWMPIGIDYNNVQDKLGTFEGNNYSIIGVYVNRDADFNGIFGNSNTIKNITLKNSYIQGNSYTGGITGALRSGKIESCENKKTDINGIKNNCGGIVGCAWGNIYKCTSNGSVFGSKFVGGITGNSMKNNSELAESINNAIVKGEEFVSGIIGHSVNTISINNCINKGKIEGNRYVGGIYGYSMLNSTKIILAECKNTGSILGNDLNIGGITGGIPKEGEVSECNNSGAISGKGDEIGGIAGVVNGVINKCNNTGTVEGQNERVGGIAGAANSESTVIDCKNSGTITGKEQYTGGIVGLMAHTNNVTNAKVEKCYNSGEVNGNKDTGGIVGFLAGSEGQGTVIKVYNKGYIKGITNIGEVMGSEKDKTRLNALNRLFYLKNNRGLTAIGDEADDENKKIMWVEKDLSYEEFKTWIENQ